MYVNYEYEITEVKEKKAYYYKTSRATRNTKLNSQMLERSSSLVIARHATVPKVSR